MKEYTYPKYLYIINKAENWMNKTSQTSPKTKYN